MNQLRTCLEVLLNSEFICVHRSRELFRCLQDPVFRAEVEAALQPLGRTLGALGDESSPDVFFARYTKLDSSVDVESARAMLVSIRDQVRPCVEFIQLSIHAGRSDSHLEPGDEISFSALLEAIEEQSVYKDRLRDLASFDMFNRAKSAKDNKDRLSIILKAMADAGYVVKRDGESANYIATGKMAYLHQVIGWIADYYIEGSQDEQESLVDGQAQQGMVL
ncbi:hypothetical protein M1D96_13960 [Pseudomonas sp. D1-3]